MTKVSRPWAARFHRAAAAVLLLGSTAVLQAADVAPEAPRDPIPRGGGHLKNHWVTCVVAKSGNVGGIWDNISGRRLVQESFETYHLKTRDGKTITISEKEDMVHSAISSAPPPNRPQWGNAMVYFARNPKIPGSEIRKSYYFALVNEEQRIVCRSIAIKAPATKPTLLSTVSTTVLAPAFRKDAVFHYVVPQGVSGDQRPLIPAAAITRPILRRDHGNDDVGRAASDAFNPRWKIGLAQYLFRVGRYWVYPRGLEHPSTWNPNGWTLSSGGYFLDSGRNRIETRFHITRGDRLVVHEEYLQLPEIQKLREETRPELSHVRSPGTGGQFLRPGDRRPGFQFIGAGQKGQFRWGQFADSDEAVLEQVSDARPTHVLQRITGLELKEQFAKRRKQNPHELGGMYIYRGQDSPVLKAHPDWLLKRLPNGIVHTRLVPDLFQFEARGILAESDFLGTGLYYWDAALDAGQIDWERQTVAQTQAVLDRWRTLYTALHKQGKLLWVNARTGSMFYDITYYEASGAQKVPGKTWRDGADMDLMNKIYQVPGTIHVPLYWWANGPQQNTQRYQSLCVALALSPRGGAWTVPVDGDLPANPDDGVLGEVVDEFRDARFSRIGLQPAWWSDLETDIEAYTLRKGLTWFINVIPHRRTSSSVEVSVDLTQTGLDPDQPVFCWQHQSRAALPAGQAYPSAQADRYFTQRTLTRITAADSRLNLSLKDVPPERVRACSLGQVPAWIVAADGIPTQLRLADTLGCKVQGSVNAAQRQIELSVNASRPIDLAAWWNAGWGPARVLVDGLAIPARIDRTAGETLLIFPLPKGEHTVVLTN